MQISSPLFWSASTAGLWHRCERAVYHNQVQYGRGIEGDWAQEDLLYGSVLHEGLEQLAVGKSPEVASLRQKVETGLLSDPLWERNLLEGQRLAKASEWGRLLVGQLRGVERTLIPFLRARYSTVQAEAEGALWSADGGSALLAKPDWLLEECPPLVGHMADTGGVCVLVPSLDPPPYPGLGYLEWKSVASPSEGWYKQWQRNPQSWTGAITQCAKGRDVQWFQVAGLVKGSETWNAANGFALRNSPWCWAWRFNAALGPKKPKAAGNGTEFLDGCVAASDGTLWRSEGTTRKGWERVSTDLWPGGVEGWVAALPVSVVQAQFVLTEPMDIDWALAEEWLGNMQATLVQHLSAAGAVKGSPNVQKALFRRTGLGGCEGGIGRSACFALEACHGSAASDPLGSGRYRLRRPHHPLEAAAQKGV